MPRRPYWYRFLMEGTEASPTGLVRTAPAAGDLPDRIRLALAGCQHFANGWFGALRHLSREPDLDAVFHYGDYIYDHPAGRRSDNIRDSTALLSTAAMWAVRPIAWATIAVATLSPNPIPPLRRSPMSPPSPHPHRKHV